MNLMAHHLRIGARGEDIAVTNLKKCRYRIIERNYRCRFGEVDIIALDKGTIVFVEVKTRSTEAYGTPETSVTLRKQHQLTKVALCYLQQKDLLNRDARFDVVAIKVGGERERVNHIKNAFEISPWIGK